MHQNEFDVYTMFKLRNKFPYYNEKGLSGLINSGNTCFFNSIIQCLSNTICLTDYFLSKKHLEDENLYKIKLSEEKMFINIYFSVLVKIWEKNNIINPKNLIINLSKIIKKKGYLTNQQDSHECLIYMLNTLHKGLSYKVEMEVTGEVKSERDKLLRELYDNYKSNFEKNYSIITKLFIGQILNKIECDKCNYKNNVFEIFNTLTLNFPEDTNNNKEYDIHDLLKNTFKTELIKSYKCEDCKKNTNCKKSNYLINLPDYLIIHLNRFKSSKKTTSKINNLVNFPIENLDITEYFHPSEKNNWIYTLYAVNYHSGTTESGHYWSNCKNLNGNWYIFNDENTSKFLNDQCIVTNEAYILFYHRKYIKKN
jgi:ubiquitin C-terminal hydrolase